MAYRSSSLILIVLLGFTSCVTTYNMGSFQIEILKPALFTIPENIDTVAIFKRDFYKSDTVIFKYTDVDNARFMTDSLLHYHDLSNSCATALANTLVEKGYFSKVFNFRDSLNSSFPNKDILVSYYELQKKLGAEICIFLDFFHLDDHLSNNSGYSYGNPIIDRFPEFKNSTKLETVGANLLWTVSFRGDTSVYLCRQPDELYYGNSAYPDLFGNDRNHRQLLLNSSEYLGRSFAAKIIPTWLKVERAYYRSNNINMLKAEKYCKEGEWLKAAEIYNRETKNKNRNIAAKAKYNMALVCEMEGKLDAAIDWLVKSSLTYKYINEVHQHNCQQYIDIIAMRRKEVKMLGKQVWNQPENE